MRTEPVTRRGFFRIGAGAAAGLALTAGCDSQMRQEPAVTQPVTTAAKGFTIGVCDWTIGKKTNPEALALAKKIGLDGVQVDFGAGEKELPLFDPALQQQYLAAVREQQIRIASLAMGVLNNIPFKSDPRAEAWVDKAIDVSAAMGNEVILLAFFGKGDIKGDASGTDAVVARLRNIAPKAEKAGVTLAIESWLSAADHLQIIDGVGSNAVKVYYDVGNSHKAGYDIYTEIRTLSNMICEFHAKDYDNLYGMGSIDFPKVREAMDAIGYRGWLVMEGTKMPLGVEKSCRYDAQYLRTVFPKIV